MGEKIDPIVDPVPGVECGNWDVPADTPEVIYVLFWDIFDCPGLHQPPPNGHLFKLDQVDGIPCRWEYDSVAFGYKVLFDALGIAPWRIELRAQNMDLYFSGGKFGNPQEHDVLTNDNPFCGGGFVGNLGFATPIWKKAAVDLILSFNLPTDSPIMMEFFMKDDVSPVYKFCFPKYSMNVKFLVSP